MATETMYVCFVSIVCNSRVDLTVPFACMITVCELESLVCS